MADDYTDAYYAEYLDAGRPMPLTVLNEPDQTFPWEVHYDETPACSVPIAEFPTWEEAIEWAFAEVALSEQTPEQTARRRALIADPWDADGETRSWTELTVRSITP